MKNYKKILAVLLSTSLLSVLWPNVLTKEAKAADSETIEDVQLICEKIYMKNGSTYALLDFNTDHVSELSVDETHVISGHALHHVKIQVTPGEEMEISLLIDDGADSYETSFIICPMSEDLEKIDDLSENIPGEGLKIEEDLKDKEARDGEKDPNGEEAPYSEGAKDEEAPVGAAQDNIGDWDDEDDGDDEDDWDDEDGSDNEDNCDDEDDSDDEEDPDDENAPDDEEASDDGDDPENENWNEGRLSYLYLYGGREEFYEAGTNEPEEEDSNPYLTFASDTSRDVIVEYTGSSSAENGIEDATSSDPGTTEQTEETEQKQQTNSGQNIIQKTKNKELTNEAQRILTDGEGQPLADGSYLPSGFQWTGGSGKLKGIDCTEINVTYGEATATIVFQSGNYRYVKLDGNVYYPVEQTADMTAFEIPVVLNRNMEIVAMTSAMSRPHEIPYAIYIRYDGKETATVQMERSYLGKVVSLDNAYTYDGLTYLGSLETDFAGLFRIHFYNNDLTVLEVLSPFSGISEESLTESSLWDTRETDSEDTDLYSRRILRYLIIPEDAEIPVGIEKETILVQEPIDAAYVDSEAVWSLMEERDILSQLSSISDIGRLSGQEKLKEKVDAGEIRCLGTAEELSVKELLLEKCDLTVLRSDACSDARLWEKLTGELSLLKIPLIVDRSAEEKTAEAQKEWKKVTELLFGLKDEA